jgi:hypothetical protein
LKVEYNFILFLTFEEISHISSFQDLGWFSCFTCNGVFPTKRGLQIHSGSCRYETSDNPMFGNPFSVNEAPGHVFGAQVSAFEKSGDEIKPEV